MDIFHDLVLRILKFQEVFCSSLLALTRFFFPLSGVL